MSNPGFAAAAAAVAAPPSSQPSPRSDCAGIIERSVGVHYSVPSPLSNLTANSHSALANTIPSRRRLWGDTKQGPTGELSNMWVYVYDGSLSLSTPGSEAGWLLICHFLLLLPAIEVSLSLSAAAEADAHCLDDGDWRDTKRMVIVHCGDNLMTVSTV